MFYIVLCVKNKTVTNYKLFMIQKKVVASIMAAFLVQVLTQDLSGEK
jgi:hypothetical protein